MSKAPAILGGSPAFTRSFTPYLTIGEEEKAAVLEVLDEGSLSGFIGAWVPEFYGGERVRALEVAWAERFGVKHAVSVNSATSGLNAAVGALGIEPGDEVIVTPTSMTATSTAIVIYQAIPIFVDICPYTYCIDPRKIEEKITDRTKAIIAVDIYGETAEWDAIRVLADKHRLKIIEDAAQAQGGTHNGRKSGTLGDIGIFSLNRHKHIHCGEGGICVTDDDDLAERMRLIRNHGEAVVVDKETADISNLVGFNYRMPEIEAAIALQQLKKLDHYIDQRVEVSQAIGEAFSGFAGIYPPVSSPLQTLNDYPDLSRPASTDVKHVYYYLCFRFDREKTGMSRKAFVKALQAEGIPMGEGGYLPLYLQPMYQRKIAFGSKGHPFTAEYYGKDVDYDPGLCPNSEKAWFDEMMYFPTQSFIPSPEEIARFPQVIENVLGHSEQIERESSAD
jgi:perosamine synthetase